MVLLIHFGHGQGVSSPSSTRIGLAKQDPVQALERQAAANQQMDAVENKIGGGNYVSLLLAHKSMSVHWHQHALVVRTPERRIFKYSSPTQILHHHQNLAALFVQLTCK